MLLVALAFTPPIVDVEALEVSGRVIDPDGAPIENAAVLLASFLDPEQRAQRILHGLDPFDVADEVATDKGGRYRLTAPELGLYAVVVEAPGHRAMIAMLQPLLHPRTLPDVTPASGKALRAQVLDIAGQPVKGARLRLNARRLSGSTPHAAWQLYSSRGTTDEAGMAELLGGEGENWWLTVLANGFAPLTRKIASGSAQVTLERGQGRLLRFVDPQGRGVPAVVSHRREPIGRADAQGLFSLPIAEPLEVQIESGDLAANFKAAVPEIAPETESPKRQAEPLEIALEPLPEWSGRVINYRTQNGVADAMVWSVWRPDRPVYTDRTGRFTIALQPREHLTAELRAAKRGFNLGSLPFRESYDFLLTPARLLTGRVVGPDQAPVEGAGLHLLESEPSSSGFKWWPTSSGPDGRFHLLVPTEADLQIGATAEGFGDVFTAVEKGDHGPILVELGPLRTASGEIVDSGGAPVAGARIFLNPVDGNRSQRLLDSSRSMIQGTGAQRTPATSDVDGRFIVTGLSGDLFSLRIEAESSPALIQRRFDIPSRPLDAELGRFELEAGLMLEGQVIGEGEPLEGVQVHLAGEQIIRRYAATTTDADGKFDIDGLPQGQGLNISLTKPGWWFPPMTFEASSEPQTFEMIRASVVTGRVLTEEGSPVAQASVMLNVLVDSRHDSSKEDGFFRIELAPGRYDLQVKAEGFREYRESGLVLTKNPLEIDVVLERGLVVSGVVLDPEGTPLKNAAVSAHAGHFSASSRLTGQGGRFELAGLDPGPVELIASHGDWGQLPLKLDLVGKVHDLEFRFPAGVELSGRVVDTATGEGIVDAHLSFVRSSPQQATQPSLNLQRPTRTVGDGRFVLAHLVPGTYSVTAYHSDYPQSLQPNFEVGEFGLRDLVLEMTPGHTLNGRVVGAAPEDVRSLEINAPGFGNSSHVEEDGRFTFKKIPPGDWIVSASDREGRQARLAVRVEADQPPADIELTFDDDGFTVTGEVRSNGQVLAGAFIIAKIEGFRDLPSTESDHRGRFTLRGLRAGLHHVAVWQQGRILVGREIELTSDDHWLLDLDAGRLEGRTVDRAGYPLRDVEISVTDLDWQDAGASHIAGRSDSFGVFSFEIPAGTYQLTAKRDELQTTRRIGIGDEGLSGLELVLEQSRAVKLRPVLFDGGRPRIIAVVRLNDAGQAIWTDLLKLDAEGVARLEKLPPGEHDLLISEPAGPPVEWKVAVPESGGPADGGSPVLPAYGSIRIDSEELTREGIGLRVRAFDASGRLFKDLNEGAWSQDGISKSLPVGVWRLEIESADGRDWQTEVSITAGERSTIQIP